MELAIELLYFGRQVVFLIVGEKQRHQQPGNVLLPHLFGELQISMEHQWLGVLPKVNTAGEHLLHEKDEVAENEVLLNVAEEGGLPAPHGLFVAILLMVLLQLAQSAEQLLAS